MTQATKTPANTVPTQKTITEASAALKGATLQTIAAVVGNAAATLKRIAGTADAIKGSVTSAVIAVVSKAVIADVVGPLKATIEASGGRVSNLSTVRAGIVKMHACYGADYTLPHWDSVAMAKTAGDAAMQAMADSVVVDGVVNAERNVAVMTALDTACTVHGIRTNESSKWKENLQALIQQVAERHEAGEDDAAGADNDAGEGEAKQDEAAMLRAELETLRAIAKEARRIFATEDLTALAIVMMETDAA